MLILLFRCWWEVAVGPELGIIAEAFYPCNCEQFAPFFLRLMVAACIRSPEVFEDQEECSENMARASLRQIFDGVVHRPHVKSSHFPAR